MKIMPEHLARGAYVYVRQSTADQLANNHESGVANTAWPIAPVALAGATSPLSTTTSGARVRVSAVPDSRSSWRRSVRAAWVRCSR